MTKPKIGFIGLGLMGEAICQNLIDRGYPLNILVNKTRTAADALIARGATECASAKTLAECSDILFLCVDTSQSVEGRMYGDDGVIAGLSEGKTVIDFGTSLPGSTRDIGEKVAAKGAHYLDAPMGRTPAHARDGLLNLMCSGEKTAFDKVEPTLKDMGENVFYLGALGTGHTIKLMNNFFGMTIANAMAEAFAVADQVGVDKQQLYDVISAGPLHCMMMDFVKAYAVEGNPDALAFAIKNAAKDLGYYHKMTSDAGIDSQMIKSPLGALEDATAKGHGDEMVSQMFDYYSQKYGK